MDNLCVLLYDCIFNWNTRTSRVWQSIRDITAEKSKSCTFNAIFRYTLTFLPVSSVHCSLEHPFRHLLFCSPVFWTSRDHSNCFRITLFSVSSRCASLTVCVSSISNGGFIFKFSSAILLNFTLLHCTVKRVLVPWVCGCNYCSLIAFQPFSRFLCSSPNPSHKCKLQYLKRSSMCLIFLLPSLFFMYFCMFHCSTLLLRMYDFHTWAVSVGWTQVKPA